MKVLKETGTYLEERAKLNRDTSIIFFIIGILGLVCSPTLFHFIFWFVFVFVIGIGGFFLERYFKYNKGLGAEKLVSKFLQDLDNSYFLINDVKLPNNYGNIDHMVLGPNGIFVIVLDSGKFVTSTLPPNFNF